MSKSLKLMPLSFFKAGGIYTGNIDAMRFMVKKEASSESESEERLFGYVWPGPFIFEATKDELKVSQDFELSEEGIKETADWISDQYSESREEYSKPLSLLECDERLKNPL